MITFCYTESLIEILSEFNDSIIHRHMISIICTKSYITVFTATP